MRVLAWLALLAVPALSGCLSFLDDEPEPREVAPADVGFDPESIEVAGATREAFTVASFDGVSLAAVAYVPRSADTLPDGSAPRWPVAVFLHGWGLSKETFEGTDAAAPQLPAPPEGAPVPLPANRLEEFALAGILSIAYDARGFGQSGGQATVAGPAELEDLRAVLAAAGERYDTSGFVGLVGESYGAGQSLLAWAQEAGVATAVSIVGWADLYEGLVQGNVPKLEWAQVLYGLGAVGSRGRLHPMVHEWYADAFQRTGLDGVEAAMDVRSVGPLLAGVDKPLLVCQGLQESLFPQADLLWQRPAGFTRAYLYTGGHGAVEQGCWDRALDWLRFFLGGFETGVDGWPALVAVDAADGRVTEYAEFPPTVDPVLYLRAPDLARAPGNSTFTVEQRLLANPFQEPSAVWDQLGAPSNAVPSQFRQDPTAVFFTGPPAEESQVLAGAPVLRLRLADGQAPPFQVTGVLFQETGEGSQARSRILSRAAFAALGEADAADGNVTLRFHFTHANLAPGDRLVLKLGANDPSWWYPLMADYGVTFTGASELRVPHFSG